jgi:hypothetical protein
MGRGDSLSSIRHLSTGEYLNQLNPIHVLTSYFSKNNFNNTQPLIQRVSGALYPGVKQQGCEADHSHPSSAEVKNGGATFPYVFMA